MTFCLSLFTCKRKNKVRIYKDLVSSHRWQDDISRPSHAGQWQQPVGNWSRRSEVRASESPCNEHQVEVSHSPVICSIFLPSPFHIPSPNKLLRNELHYILLAKHLYILGTYMYTHTNIHFMILRHKKSSRMVVDFRIIVLLDREMGFFRNNSAFLVRDEGPGVRQPTEASGGRLG